MLGIVKWAMVLVLIGLFTAFALANSARVVIDVFLLPIQLEVPLFMVIFVSMIVGCVLAYVLNALTQARLFASQLKYKQRIQALENEVKGLYTENTLRKPSDALKVF